MSVPLAQGSLDTTAFPRLLLGLYDQRFSGAVGVSRDRVRRRILLAEGAPLAADPEGSDEGLAEQLRDAGRLSEEDRTRVAARAAQCRSSEAAALLDLGLLPPREILLALRERARRRLLDCFGWTRGEWCLEPEAGVPEDNGPLRLDALRLVQEGLVRHWPPDRLLADLAPRAGTYPVATEKLASLRRRLEGEDVAGLLDACDGGSSLAEVLERATSPRLLAAVWLADAAGGLAYRDAPEPRAKAGVPSTPAPAPPPPPEVEIVFGDEGEQEGVRAASPGRARPGARAPGPKEDPESLRREVRERHARLGELDHYGVLGIERDADTGAVKRAYFAAAKRFHPDALAGLGLGDVREEATALFAAVARAYETLSDPKRRREYDAGGEGPGAGEADRLANAEALYRKAEILMRGGDFAGALPYLRPAVQLAPEDPAYRSALGWCLFKRNPPAEAEARSQLEKALELAPRDATGHLRLAVVLRALGEEDAAARHRRRALELDPQASVR